MTTTYNPIHGAVSAAIDHGTKFIVNCDDRIIVDHPERMPVDIRNRLRTNWLEAAAHIVERERVIRDAESVSCAQCGHEIAKWINNYLWLPGYVTGWGSSGWANMGQAIERVRCEECDEIWYPRYGALRDPRVRP